MIHFKTTNGYEIFRVSSLRSNSYLISYQDKFLLIDTGAKADESSLLKHISSVMPEGKRISYLILTHTHFDHCQNAKALKDRENCKILVSRKEGEFVLNGYTPIPHGTYPFTEFLTNEGRKIGDKWFGYDAFSPDILIDENYDLDGQGANIEIISTPGHSPGSLTVIVDHEYALVGDAMINSFTHTLFPPFGDDRDELIRSWKKILDTGCSTLLPGHGKPLKRELLEKEYQKFVTRDA